ncbi:unnamed protein product [Oncorhynchus mykiss]|uniref:OAR domain-containing protein n=1 Tax=Oncorhynchus mykiss TaxID=8022 RepID=A0A060YGJ6_ONCMY|nr:unnamed protein product [Oncorhynchus mykiss]
MNNSTHSMFFLIMSFAMLISMLFYTMATYPPTCSNPNTSQGMNMANSIANLRLKAKEYSLNQVPTVN